MKIRKNPHLYIKFPHLRRISLYPRYQDTHFFQPFEPPNFPIEPKVREENLEDHVKLRGLQQTYLALETSQDQSHQASKLIWSEAKDQFGGLLWLVKWNFKIESTKRQLSWLCTKLYLLPLCKRLLKVSTPCAKIWNFRSEDDLGSNRLRMYFSLERMYLIRERFYLSSERASCPLWTQ